MIFRRGPMSSARTEGGHRLTAFDYNRLVVQFNQACTTCTSISRLMMDVMVCYGSAERHLLARLRYRRHRRDLWGKPLI
jgi:hypothetical protein